MSNFVVSLRAVALLAFLFVMPLLAIPAVGKWYDAWLLGEVSVQSSVEGQSGHSPKRRGAPPTFESGAGIGLDEETASARQPASEGADAHRVVSAQATQDMAERFEAIPKRLQELGAEYLRLESVDEEARQFRFVCRMPLGGSAAYSRPFEVTAADPVEAMERVLVEVEAWQTARDKTPETRAARRP
jgi:hypothetical protein